MFSCHSNFAAAIWRSFCTYKTDIDYCLGNPCGAEPNICTDGVNSYTCNCGTGYQLSADQTTCASKSRTNSSPFNWYVHTRRAGWSNFINMINACINFSMSRSQY
jgi:hypothetical protein